MDWIENTGTKPDYVGPIEVKHVFGQIKAHASVDTPNWQKFGRMTDIKSWRPTSVAEAA